MTTADERTWKFDRPVLFLGEWCRLYERKQIWESMDATVARPYGLRAGEKERDIAYVQSLTRHLLEELADALNVFHGVHHGLRSWEIVLGHWLQRYVATVFNRYSALEFSLQEHEVSGTSVFDSADYSLATANTMDFIWACNDDVWNHVLYARIMKFLGWTRNGSDSVPLQGVTGFKRKEIPRRRNAKRFILHTANRIWHKFSKRDDAFIVNSFLPLAEEAKLQISLRQCPQLWRSPALRNAAPDPEGKRRRFSINAENHAGFERFVREQLGQALPVCFLEGYGQLVQQIESLPWPASPKFIFTSNNFDTDEIFKVWTASKAEKGVPYFTGQHGSNYGTHQYLGNQKWPERTMADKFLTWGWTDGDPRNLPGFVFTIAGRKPPRVGSGGSLLLIELHPPHRFGPEDSYYEFGGYQEEQFRFVAALPEAIQQKLTARLHHGYRSFRWSDEQRWKDRSPHTQVETGVVPLQKLIANSRLVVHSYDSTGILETLALNIPTMCFWHGGLDHLLPSAKPYYELLRNAGILADTPEQAAEHIALHWDNIGGWWESKEVQEARKVFCNQYARTEKHPIRAMKRLLTAQLGVSSK